MSENQQVEWKESWRDEYLKWVCGFANAQGGVLEIGRDDRGRAIGLSDAGKLMKDLPNKMRDTLGIVADVDLLEDGGHDVVRITVEPYPYPVSYKGQYHYRAGSTKQELKGAALDRFLLGKTGKHWDAVPQPHLAVDALDEHTLTWFRDEAIRRQRLPESIRNDDDSVLIERLRLTEGDYLKRAAALLFHPEPQRFFSGAFVKIGYFKSDSDLKFHDVIEGNLFTQLDRTMDLLLTKYTHASLRFTGREREEVFPLPEPALREALVNAIAHKDYSSGNPIQISVYDDRIMIWNDGHLPQQWTIKDLLRKHASIPFNPDIARVFFLAGRIEAWGTGIDRMFAACAEHGCPEPVFRHEPIGLMTTLSFMVEPTASPRDTTEKTTEKSGEKTEKQPIGSTASAIIQAMQNNPYVTIAELAGGLDRSTSAIEKQIAKLRDLGHIRRVGPDKGGYWEVLG